MHTYIHTYIRTYVRSTVNEIVKLEVSNSWYLQKGCFGKIRKIYSKATALESFLH